MALRKRRLSKDSDTTRPAIEKQETCTNEPATTHKQPLPSPPRTRKRLRTGGNATAPAATTSEDAQPKPEFAKENGSRLQDTHDTQSPQNAPEVIPRPPTRSARSRRPGTHGTSSQARHKPQGLLSLPIELKQQIFLNTTARDVTRLRRVCKALKADISGSTKYLAKEIANRELVRLQHDADEWISLEVPTDITSLMKAMHVWVKRRSHFEDDLQSFDSFTKLVGHLFRKKKKDPNIVREMEDWAGQLSIFSRIRRRNEKDRVLPHTSFFYQLRGSLPITQSEREMLYHYDGRVWPFGTPESATFPGRRKMTPLLHSERTMWSSSTPAERQQRWQEFLDYLDGESSMPLLEATQGNPHLLRYLRLPILPNEISCYYLKEEWACREVERLLARFVHLATKTHPVRVKPMLRAAILESVMLF